ncbi:FHA domain-containing protein [Protaetiibacter intestinalis]|uniref:FHA domain-containing protein n=1 Tax=Protaetiibacter intestinalis TaxID=2419774 RepID=A0A387BE98_9MICO|nr:FHA domain-containing protein [Protaetiibacter intestinalis]
MVDDATDRPESVPSDAVNTPAAPDPVSNDTTAHFTDDFRNQLAAMESVSGEEQEAIAALPSGSALLVVRRGPNVGARFLLDADVTVAGRHPDADIFLDDVTVSRRHAEFVRTGSAFQVRDLGSLNGTYFDGVRIDSALLSDGAEVQVGKFRLTFYASRADRGTTA